MKSQYYSLYSIEDFKKLVFFKMKALGFKAESAEAMESNDSYKAAVSKSLNDEIEKIESTLNDYKQYLNELTA